ncbi:MAG: tetratricopeptide repeat protein [Phormidesmis sp.]
MKPCVALSLSLVSSIACVLAPASYTHPNAAAYGQSKQALSRVALSAEMAGELALAENMWQQHSQLYPNDAVGYVSLGYVRLDQGKVAEAVGAFETALQISELSVGAHMGLGTIAQQNGDLAAAEAALRKVIEINPQVPFGYLKLGRLLRNKRDFSAAAEAFQQVTQLNPLGHSGAIAYWELGKTHMAQNQPAEARLDYHRAIGLEPDNLEFWQSLSGAVRAEPGLTAELASIAGEIKRIKESNKQQQAQRQDVLAEQFNVERDRQQLSEAQRLLAAYPDNVTFLQDLGTALRRLGEFEAAANAFRQAAFLSPNNALAFYHLSEAFRDLDNISEADAAYQVAISLYPDLALSSQPPQLSIRSNPIRSLPYQSISYPPVPQTLARAAGNTFQTPIAASFSRRLPSLSRRTLAYVRPSAVSAENQLQLDPDSAALHGNRAGVLEQQGNFTEAANAYKEMARLDPRMAALAFNNLGVMLHGQAQFEAAAAAFEDAIRSADEQLMESESAYSIRVVYENFGHMLEQQGNWQRAVEVYTLALARGIGEDALQQQWESSRVQALRSLARASVEAEQYDVAVTAYEALITDFATQSYLADELATVLFKQGKLDAAASVYRAVIAAAPAQEYFLHNGLVTVLNAQGRSQEAEEIAARFRPALPSSRPTLPSATRLPRPRPNTLPRPLPSLSLPSTTRPTPISPIPVFSSTPVPRRPSIPVLPVPNFPRAAGSPTTPVRLVVLQSPLASVQDTFAQAKLERGQYDAAEAVLLQRSERSLVSSENLLTLGLAQLYQGDTEAGYNNLSEASNFGSNSVVRCYIVPPEVTQQAWLPEAYLRTGTSCLF